MQRQGSRKARASDATPLSRPLPPPLAENLICALQRLEEKRGSRPPPAARRAARTESFEQLLRDFVSEVSRKRGTAPP